MTNLENNEFPVWGQYPKKNPKFNYVRAKLDAKIIPEISDEDFRALSDFPLIYIYISPIQSDGRKYYIGQTIDVSRRTEEHSKKLGKYEIKKGKKEENKKYDERFESFKGGDYIAFYGENISLNLNYIEKILGTIYQFTPTTICSIFNNTKKTTSFRKSSLFDYRFLP